VAPAAACRGWVSAAGNREIYRDDLARSEYLAHVGWRRIRVIAGDRKPDIVRRVRQAWR